MGDNEKKEYINENNKIEWFKEWFADVERLFAVLGILVCGFVASEAKRGKTFLTFNTRQPIVNDFLHEHIFSHYVEKVTQITVNPIFYLMIAVIILFIFSFIVDAQETKKGFVLRSAGMCLASLTGLGYILVPIVFGYGKLVINLKACAFIVMVLLGFALAVTTWVCYQTGKKRVDDIGKNLKLTMALYILGCMIGAGVYLAVNLSGDYLVCYETNKLLKKHPTKINQDIAYQMGNVARGESVYNNGCLYFISGGTVWCVDNAGTVTKLYTLPKDGEFCSYGIYFYQDCLYAVCVGYHDLDAYSIVEISVTDETVREVCAVDSYAKYFGLADGKLLYAKKTESDRADIYYIDLKKKTDVIESVLYDKGIDTLIYFNSNQWLQKYLYGYLDTVYSVHEEVQFIGENGYYMIEDKPDDYYYPWEYDYLYVKEEGYSVGRGRKLMQYNNTSETIETVLEDIVYYNVYNETIYYLKETESGYNINFCDKDGENQTYIASVPVAFQDSDSGCHTELYAGDEFIVCTVRAKYLDHKYYYFISLEDGSVKELKVN